MKKTLGFLCFAFLLGFSACTDDENGNDDDNGLPASLPGNVVNGIYVTEDGLRYFATDKGIASFDGSQWTVHDDNPKVTKSEITDLDFELTSYGPEFWLGTHAGINVVVLPIDATSGATTYTTDNTATLFPGQPGLVGDSIFAVKVDDKNIRWFGTNNGLSAFRGNQWPEIDFANHYGADFFKNNPITSFDYRNDTVYIGTMGGGVARMLVPAPDAITGASPFEIPWSNLPSPNITAVFIDGNTQWYGSDEGLGRHEGIEAKENWSVYFESDGLVNNHIQAINKDNDGNLWLGTRGGLSMYVGGNFTNFTTADGLAGNNVLCITIDKDGTIWFGTDNGASHFDGSVFTTYRANN